MAGSHNCYLMKDHVYRGDGGFMQVSAPRG